MRNQQQQFSVTVVNENTGETVEFLGEVEAPDALAAVKEMVRRLEIPDETDDDRHREA